MKLRYRLWSAMLVIVALSQGAGALLAQDVAAAARANRAAHAAQNNTASASAYGETQNPADALKMCLADNTSGKDRKDLAKWVFFAMAVHPEIKQYANANAGSAADESSKTMAALVTRLLTESCVNQVRAAVNTGQGSQAVSLAFETLGKLAMQELMADKNVQDAMSSFGRYVDQGHLQEALSGK